MNRVILLNLYGGFIVVIATAVVTFYVNEYMKHGGSRQTAVFGGVKGALMFYPLALGMFLAAQDMMEWNQLLARAYFVLLVFYGMQSVRSRPFRENRTAISKNFKSSPVLWCCVIGSFAALFLPAVIILTTYAF